MRLTTYTDYTIRVLIYMGLNPTEWTTVAELAERYAISRNHLSKVIYHLGQLGYIETLRGKGGGIRLLAKPENVNLGALIRKTEGGSVLVECFETTKSHCKITPACRLTPILAEAQEGFYKVLEKYTLADLVKAPDLLTPLLSGNR